MSLSNLLNLLRLLFWIIITIVAGLKCAEAYSDMKHRIPLSEAKEKFLSLT